MGRLEYCSFCSIWRLVCFIFEKRILITKQNRRRLEGNEKQKYF